MCQKNPTFGTNTLHNLQGHYLHISCFTSFLKIFIVFFCLISSGESVHSWDARELRVSRPLKTVLFLSD